MKLKIEKFSKHLIDYTNINFLKYIANKNVIIDIGCGEGEFIIELAKLHPNKQFIGIEIKYGRLMKCLKKAYLHNFDNLNFLICDATIFIEKLLPDSSLNKVFINNPDPWPKEKHEKNRILNVSFLNNINKKMKRKGNLYVKTDSKEYFSKLKENINHTNFVSDTKISKFDETISLTKFQKLYTNQKKKIYSIKLLKK